jgi:hypothetical protein
MKSVELLMANARQPRDDVDLARQCYKQRHDGYRHEPGADGQRRRAVAASLAVVWPLPKGHGEEDGRRKDQKDQHAQPRNTEFRP